MAIQTLYLHPNDLEEFRQHCPYSFTKQAQSNTANKSEIVLGSVYERGGVFLSSYATWGYGRNSLDFLEKTDEDIPRICCYLTNVDTVVVDGITKAYIQYDDENQIAMGRFGITFASSHNNNSSNLTQLLYEPTNNYRIFTWSEQKDTLNEAIWTEAKDVVPSAGSASPIKTINIDANNKILSSLVIDASIPIFVDEESARDYITTGNVQAGKCFNLDAMMLSEPTQYMISTRSYEYDSDKNCTAQDNETHVIYLRTFSGQSVSGYVADDKSKYNIRLKVAQNSSSIDTVQVRVGSDTFETMTIAEFNNSIYANGYNTYKDFKPYNLSGYVKGNLWRCTFDIMASEADCNMRNNPQTRDMVVPLNFDKEGNPINMSDTGEPANSENDLDDTYKDGASGLITLYQLSKANLVTLGNAIFDTSTSIGDVIKDALSCYGDSPINAIVSVYHTPIDISAMCQLSNDSLVKLGLYNLTCEGAQTVLRYGKIMTLGSIVVNPFYNDFRDYTNFRFELHLPFSAPIALDAKEIMNKTLTIKCTCDAYAMQLRYYICIDGIVDRAVDCSFGHQIAIMGNDFAGKAKEVRQELISVAGTAIGLATGTVSTQSVDNSNQWKAGAQELTQQTDVNVGAVAGSTMGQMASLNNILTEPKKTMVGTFASGCAESDVLYPYLSITETASIKPDNLESTFGRPTNYIGKLGNLSGFTCCELVKLQSDCLDSERTELEQLLRGGVII